MDAPFAQGEDNRLLDVIQDNRQPAPDSGLLEQSLKEEVKRALATLSERESQVIKLYFGLDSGPYQHPVPHSESVP